MARNPDDPPILPPRLHYVTKGVKRLAYELRDEAAALSASGDYDLAQDRETLADRLNSALAGGEGERSETGD